MLSLHELLRVHSIISCAVRPSHLFLPTMTVICLVIFTVCFFNDRRNGQQFVLDNNLNLEEVE